MNWLCAIGGLVYLRAVPRLCGSHLAASVPTQQMLKAHGPGADVTGRSPFLPYQMHPAKLAGLTVGDLLPSADPASSGAWMDGMAGDLPGDRDAATSCLAWCQAG
jgi:hypothetical protein